MTEKRERHWYNKGGPVCIFCEIKHWGDACEVVNTTVAAQDTGGNNVEAVDVSSASQSIIQVFVTRIKIDHPVTTELF